MAVGVAKYLAGTKHWGLKLGHSNLHVVGYCDSAYASCPDTARSTTGYVFMVYGGVVSYKSTQQPTIACSTTEAEYQACSSSAREARWLRLLLPNFKIPCTPLKVYTDSKGALSAIVNNAMTERTKHVDVHHHFVRERVVLGELLYEHVSGEHNVSDVLTKALPGPKHKWCMRAMGMAPVKGQA
jgi:ribonuclease HI